jgi:hypothetical protein
LDSQGRRCNDDDDDNKDIHIATYIQKALKAVSPADILVHSQTSKSRICGGEKDTVTVPLSEYNHSTNATYSLLWSSFVTFPTSQHHGRIRVSKFIVVM